MKRAASPPPSSISTSNCACSRLPHEIVVVDDGSTDSTWSLLQELQTRIPECRPVQNLGEHGFGRAITYGFDHVTGDAVVVMMADESDDCRDVVRYWQMLNEGWDAVFGSRFVRGGGVIDYPAHKLLLNRLANLFLRAAVPRPAERLHQRLQGLPANRDRRLPPVPLAALQPDGGTAAEDHRARILLDGHADHLAQPARRRIEAQDQGDGQPLPVHRALLLAGEVLQPRRLPREVTRVLPLLRFAAHGRNRRPLGRYVIPPPGPGAPMGAVVSDSAAHFGHRPAETARAAIAGNPPSHCHLSNKAIGTKSSPSRHGAVTRIQRFGSVAILNIHLRCLVRDGVYRSSEGVPVFHVMPTPTLEEAQALLV